MDRATKIHLFVTAIWDWYTRHKRVLPWRDMNVEDDTQRAYMVLISEIMLQQTQVSRVEIVFPRFLRQFPNLPALAKASNRDIIIAWQGMGYNSRALRLRDAARTIQEKFHGKFPADVEDLRSIKGIGPYTAGAIRNFAFGIPTPCIDTNIRRILHRVFVGPEKPDGTWKMNDKELLKIAGEVLEVALDSHFVARYSLARCSIGIKTSNEQRANEKPRRTTADWHSALMDFGSLVCRKSGVRVDICPLAKRGLYAGGLVIAAPKRTKSVAKKEPGRMVGSSFIPNRIFRGKIVEELRGEHAGLSLLQIGRRVCIDWNEREHRDWLRVLLQKLVQDGLIASSHHRYVLEG